MSQKNPVDMVICSADRPGVRVTFWRRSKHRTYRNISHQSYTRLSTVARHLTLHRKAVTVPLLKAPGWYCLV